MPLAQQRLTTLEEYEALPEDTRAEVFDGQIRDMVSIPYTFSSTIKVNIYDDLFIDFKAIEQLLNS